MNGEDQGGHVEINVQTINRLVVAYNAHDARAFADLFAQDALHGTLHTADYQYGREEIYRRYVEVFTQFPHNRSEVVHRIVIGPRVIDHERVRRSPDADPFKVLASYTLEGFITRLDFVRA
ncbi:nuclear transport factor 2 family protein [Deinococcus sp.]|uniref:nuclear transport factor 2 family protein n=1 Tax=Deinococcus sp. TaxID=47478 RepID=UPI003CC5DEDC